MFNFKILQSCLLLNEKRTNLWNENVIQSVVKNLIYKSLLFNKKSFKRLDLWILQSCLLLNDIRISFCLEGKKISLSVFLYSFIINIL